MSLHSFRVEEINAGSAHRRQEWPSPLRQSVAGCAWLPLLVKLQFGVVWCCKIFRRSWRSRCCAGNFFYLTEFTVSKHLIELKLLPFARDGSSGLWLEMMTSC